MTLRAQDLLAVDVVHVTGEARPIDYYAATLVPTPLIFAVLEEETFVGLVDAQTASHFPGRIFLDLCHQVPCKPIAETTPLDEILREMDRQHRDVLAVVEASGRFLGAVSRSSIGDVLLTQSREQLRAMFHLVEVVMDLGIVSTPAAVLQKVVELGTRLIGARYGALGVLDDEGRIVQFFTIGMDQATQDAIGRPPEGMALLGELLRNARPLRLSDLTCHPKFSGFPPHHPVMRSFLGTPIRYQGRILGNLYLAEKQQGGAFSEEDEALLAAFAGLAAIAMANAQLYAETERRRKAAESLADMGRLMSRSLDSHEITQRITDAMQVLFGVHSVSLYWLEPALGELVALAVSGDVPPAFSHLRVSPAGTGMADYVVRERQPVTTLNVLTDHRFSHPPELRTWIEQAGFQAILAVPLLVEGRVVGVLGLGDRAGRIFDAEDIELAQVFAAQAATALENARLFQDAQQAYRELAQTQEQFVQAQKMEAVGRLAGGVAHDFNNLLTVITGRSQLLQMRLDPDDPRCRDLHLIQHAADRAAALTHQLLAFSRKQVLQPKILNLNALVAHCVQMLQRLIGEDIALVTTLEPTLGWARVDPGQFDQVLLNLAINARDAMPHGGQIDIGTGNVVCSVADVSAPQGVPPGSYIRLTVRDTGIGMDTATRSRLFEPFFTTKGPGKGTGLGLATVYGIVTQSGGYIVVDSLPGQGTTFAIYLPRVDVASDDEHTLADSPDTSHGRETVLIVEDDVDVREMVRDILAFAGYTVVIAATPDEALQRCLQHPEPIHLLLTDVVLPGMTGLQVARQLVALRPTMKVLYMSGYTDDTLSKRGIQDAEITLLQKPFTPDTLARKVREVLESDCPPQAE